MLIGAAEPSGRLPQIFPVCWIDNPAHSQDREVYSGFKGKVPYEEDIFVGYRYYDRLGLTPFVPLRLWLELHQLCPQRSGHDDSDFEADGAVAVSVTVANTGARDGAAMV